MQPKDKRRMGIEGLSIPEELIVDIFSRLPVKSLLRFKLVSKSFNSLISDTHFVKLHLRRCSAPNANPRVIYFVPWDVIDDIRYIHVKSLLKTPSSTWKGMHSGLQYLRPTWKGPHSALGSCNGLICEIGFATGHYFNFDHEQQLFWVDLWNPAMRATSRKWFMLSIKRKYMLSYIWSNRGFGYDHVSDTYKVMMVLERWDQKPVIVFNMDGCNWRHIGYFPPDLTTLTLDKVGVHFNGTLNWLVVLKIYEHKFNGYESDQYDGIEWDNGSCMILSFDLNKEEFVRLLYPAMSHKFHDPRLGVLGECLCVCHYDEQENFVIWQKKEFGVDESWTKLFSINYYKELKPRDLPPPLKFPLYMFDNGDVLMLPEELLYNHRDDRVDPVHMPDSYASCAVICCESLISPR